MRAQNTQMERTGKHWISSQVARALLALAVMASAFVTVQIAAQVPAEAITCAGWNSYTTASSSSTKTAWNSASGTWQSVSASWGPKIATAGSPCVDVNVKQTNQNDIGPDIVEARGMYYSPTYHKWYHGSAGWVHSPKNVEIVVISNLTATGIDVYTGSNRVSTATITRT